MNKDAIDGIIEQWSEERPELDTGSLGVVIRVMSLQKAFLRQATEALEPMDLELFEYDVLSVLRRQENRMRSQLPDWRRKQGSVVVR